MCVRSQVSSDLQKGWCLSAEASTACCGAGLLFNWLYPAHFPAILCCLEAWADTPEVTTAILKFAAEFVLNKAQRLTFEMSSPNGILLFREVSKVHWLSVSLSM